MAVPVVYRKSKEQNLVNFNFADFATGTGFTTLYAGETTSGAIGRLSTAQFYSARPIIFSATSSVTIPTKFGQLLFDLKIERPLRLEGDLIINVPLSCHPGGTFTYQVMASGALIKLDKNGASSAIIRGATDALKQYSSNNDFSETMPMVMNVPRTLFKPNETLRIQIDAYGWCDTANGANYLVGFDPQGRLTQDSFTDVAATFPSGSNTILTAQIPFKIDV